MSSAAESAMRFESAWNAHDMDAFGLLFHPEADRGAAMPSTGTDRSVASRLCFARR